MDRKQRKNRPRKKEMSEETWASQLENIKKTYEYLGKEKEGETHE